MALRAMVLRLTRYAAKGVPGEALQNARLLVGLGMEGDFHAKDDAGTPAGERQLSLLSQEERRWMDSQAKPGLCFGRYKENILFDADLSPVLVPGTRLAVGEAVLEISDSGKHCFAQCPLFDQEQACILAGRSLFAKVIRGGLVRTGDCAEVKRDIP